MEGKLTEKKTSAGNSYFVNEDNEVLAKKCKKCGNIKVLSDFPKDKGSFAGRKVECKKCKSNYDKGYYRNNIKYIKERDRIHYKENKSSYKERRDLIREVIRKRDRDYYLNNRDKYKLKNMRRRARKSMLPDDLTESQKELIKEHFNNGCALTGGSKYNHFDHVIPLVTGHGGTIYENIIPLRSDLNFSKSDGNIFEWFEANRERFDLSQRKFDELIAYLADINGMTTKEYRDYVYWCHENPRDLSEKEAN